MKSTLYISGLLTCIIIGFALRECKCKPDQGMPEAPKEAIEAKIKEKEEETKVLKAQKSKIVYKTVFDTLATIDTVYVELIKCDSIVKIDSVIIASQDTIISDQKEVIAIVESNNSVLKKDLKKQKRKNTITKIVAVVVIVATIILLR